MYEQQDLKLVGSRIKAVRISRGMSQADLAVEASVSLPLISNIERGKTGMQLETFVKVAEALQVSADYLLRPDVPEVKAIYTKYGYHVLDRTLRLCVGTWEGDIDSLGANVLAGVARMVVAFGDQLRDETFKERVGFMSVRQLSRIAKERGAGSLCYAEAMLVAYNRKCKYTLRMTKLHSGKVAAEDDFVEENEEPLADDPVLEE